MTDGVLAAIAAGAAIQAVFEVQRWVRHLREVRTVARYTAVAHQITELNKALSSEQTIGGLPKGTYSLGKGGLKRDD